MQKCGQGSMGGAGKYLFECKVWQDVQAICNEGASLNDEGAFGSSCWQFDCGRRRMMKMW